MSETVCVIPARGVSPGLPKKNFKLIGGMPMVAHTIETARTNERIDHVYVSTESDELAEISREHGANIIQRPESLSERSVLLDSVLSHALDELEQADCVTITDTTPILMLPSNVPFRRQRDIDRALDTYRNTPDRSVISVTEQTGYFWRLEDKELTPEFDRRAPWSELDPFFRENGAIYITNKKSIQAETDYVGENPNYITTDRFSSYSVNSVLDFWVAEKLYKGPQIVFRVDGGDDIGMGHIYRCLTIAQELQTRFECNISFVSSSKYPAGIEKIQSEGFGVSVVDDENGVRKIRGTSPDIIFIDVLNTDETYMRQLRQSTAAVINLEDLDGGLEHADYVVNALYQSEGNENHFFGPDYAVLRDNFLGKKITVPNRAENILLTFGGSDPLGLSVRAVQAISKCESALTPVLVLGPDFDHHQRLYQLPDEVLEHVDIRSDVSDMGALMENADMALVSGGRTVYELLVTGTPTVAIAQNDREADRLETLQQEKNVIDYLGHGKYVSEQSITERVDKLSQNPERRQKMVERGRELVDGKGIQRIMDLVYEAFVG